MIPSAGADTLSRYPRTSRLGEKRNDFRNLLGGSDSLLDRRRLFLRLDDLRIDLVQHLALHGARIDAIYCRPVFAELDRPVSRIRFQRAFRRGVGPRSRVTLAGTHTADVHDPSGMAQMRQASLNHEQGRADVEVEDVVEVFCRDVREILVADGRGVVHEDVDVRTEGLRCFMDDLLGCVGRREVALDADRGAFRVGLDLGD